MCIRDSVVSLGIHIVGGVARSLNRTTSHNQKHKSSKARYRREKYFFKNLSQHQLYDVKIIGRTSKYHTPYRVQAVDQRARAVPGEYLRSAIQCDRTWNGTPPGTVGTFEAYLRSLPPVIGLDFGGYGEWSKEVDSLIGQLAEIASAVPERLGCCHGPAQAQGQYAQWARKHLHRES